MEVETSEELKLALRNCNDKTPRFDLKGLFKLCKVVSVYDGDTCQVVFKHRGELNRWTIRMNGYDTPEMRPLKSLPHRGRIIEKAREAKLFLSKLITPQLVILECLGFDKYGRLLGNIYQNVEDTQSVNDMMVASKLGCVYDGGTKE